MRHSLISLAALSLVAATATSAEACDNSPDLARIPGASVDEAEKRYLAYERDLDVFERLEHEKAALENSWTVYLAKIASVPEASAGKSADSVTVTPVWQVRNPLPKGRQAVSTRQLSGSCGRGVLAIAHLDPGRLVVVFEGPGAARGMSAEFARSGELIDAITMYALKVDPDQFKD